jgi:hypothetical protein
MNLEDMFELVLRPTPKVLVRGDVHGCASASGPTCGTRGRRLQPVGLRVCRTPQPGRTRARDLYDVSIVSSRRRAYRHRLYGYANGKTSWPASINRQECAYAHLERSTGSEVFAHNEPAPRGPACSSSSVWRRAASLCATELAVVSPSSQQVRCCQPVFEIDWRCSTRARIRMPTSSF